MKKRILTALLVFVMAVSVLPFSAFAKPIDNNKTCKKGHTWVNSECTVCHAKCTNHVKDKGWKKQVVEPTCTAAGYTVKYRTCKTCDKIMEQGQPYNITKKLNHVYVKGKCSCGALATAPDANVLRCGHKYQVKSQQAPTCTEPGYIEHSCTNNCKRSYFKEIIRATGHTYSTSVEALAPTCTEKGHSAYTQCACGEKKNYTEIEATGHTYSISVAAKPVSCTENGHTAYTQCACGEKKDYTEIISSGHTYDIDVPAADATCIQGGHAAYKKCACGAEQTHLGTAIDPDAHDFENGVCVLCGAEEEIPETETTTPETDEDEADDEEVTDCRHRFRRWGYSLVRATCTEAAHAKYFKVCRICGAEYDAVKFHFGRPLPHTYNIDVPAKAATCIEGGYAAHKKCICGAEEEYEVTTPDPDAHKFVDGICEYCHKGTHDSDDADRELCDDHNWVENEETKVEPGCTTEGYVLYECSKCDGEYDAVLNPAGHHFADGVCVVCGASDPNAEDEEDDGTDEDGTESEDNESAGGNNETPGGSNGSSGEEDDDNDTPAVTEKHPGCFSPSTCNGKYLLKEGKPDPTCTQPGVYEYVWPCGKLTTEVAPATGEHSYVGGVCEDCNAPDPSVEVAPPTTEEPPVTEEPEEEVVTKKFLLTWDLLNVNLIGNNKQQ